MKRIILDTDVGTDADDALASRWLRPTRISSLLA